MIEEVWPKTHGQRGCKTANVLNKLPKSQQSKAKRALQQVWMAETKKEALAAFDVFVETWGVKCDRAVECLIKHREALLAFYDFPAEYWKHLRTTNDQRHRKRIRDRASSHRARKGMSLEQDRAGYDLQIAEAAEKSWRRLDGHNQLRRWEVR